MWAKTYLKQLQRMDILVDQSIQELGELHELSRSIKGLDYSSDDKVQVSPSGDAPFTKAIERIIALEEKIDREVDAFVDAKHRRIEQIQQLPNIRHAQVLYKRYIEYKKLEDVAEEMGITYQYCVELHGRALQKFNEMFSPYVKPM